MGGLGKGVGAGLIPSFTGRLGGIGPPVGLSADKAGEAGPPDDGANCEPAGGILICGLIGLAEPFGPELTVEGLGASESFVGSAI